MAVAVAGLILSPPANVARAVENGTDTYRLLNLLGDVFERVRADYVENPTDQELIESAITGMLVSLDPHSSYLNAKSFREMQVQTRGEFGGLGIEVTMENGLVKVVSPIDDTPAFRAGIEPGDLITHLNGEPVLGLALSEAVEKMRGPVGSDLKITIRRQGRDPFDVSITRAIIKMISVRSRLEGEIGYLRITSFNEARHEMNDVQRNMAPNHEEYFSQPIPDFILDSDSVLSMVQTAAASRTIFHCGFGLMLPSRKRST